jgi:hypothetical protein
MPPPQTFHSPRNAQKNAKTKRGKMDGAVNNVKGRASRPAFLPHLNAEFLPELGRSFLEAFSIRLWDNDILEFRQDVTKYPRSPWVLMGARCASYHVVYIEYMCFPENI